MSEDSVIKVEGVSKKFRLRHAGGRTLKATILDMVSRKSNAKDEFWALKDVSFTVAKGETLGIIGSNGAGKSTLLSLVTGTFRPTTGTITANGTMASLLELGAGFHPDLSGRENVYLYGAIMGLTKKQMNARFDAIVDFAELYDWIDEPVKCYSSGMYVRLGFAVAVEVNPEILLIDEVLAVGDASFQKKCLAKMKEFRDQGKTMVIISHDLPTIQSASDRIMFLDEGTVHGLGKPTSMVNNYHQFMREKEEEAKRRVWGSQDVVIEKVTFLDHNGTPSENLASGQPMQVAIDYKAAKRIENPVFGFAVSDNNGRVLYGSNTQIENFDIPVIEGPGKLTLSINPLSVSRGQYLFSFSVHSQDHQTNFYRVENAFPVEVECERNYEGCFMPITWQAE